MDQNNRVKHLLRRNSQTNLAYWKKIRDYNVSLASCQNSFKSASNQAANKLDLAQKLSVASTQLTIDHAKSALTNDLYCPNSSTVNNAQEDFQKVSSMICDVQGFFSNTSESSASDTINSAATQESAKISGSLNQLSSVSASITSSISRRTNRAHRSIKRAAQSSATSDLGNESQVLASRSQALNSKVSSILTQPVSSSSANATALPIKVRYYDIDSNKLIKRGLAVGGYGQMINVTDLVPLPKGYRPYFYQKLYYNINSHPQLAIIFITNHKMNLKSVAQHQLIHKKNPRTQSFKSSSLMNVYKPQESYLTPEDFGKSSLWYLLIKKDLFSYSRKDLNKSSREKKLINGEIIQIKRLARYQHRTIAILPNNRYITARKDFVTVFKI